jgi:segregation and condensation protein A
VLDRAKVREDHEVEIEPVTVRQRMHQLSLLLADTPRIEFESLFLSRVWSSERELRAMLVVTLMSVLEMVKLGLLGIQQPMGSETLSLERVVDVDAMEHAVAEFHEDEEPQAQPSVDRGAEPADAESVAAPAVDAEVEGREEEPSGD